MSPERTGHTEDTGHTDDTGQTEDERRRRRASVFGDVLPESTGDDRDTGPDPDRTDEWLRTQVPPHHGG